MRKKQLTTMIAAGILACAAVSCNIYGAEGQVRSELTNEWIDQSIQDQRPIAVMVDNELDATPHYGLNQADIVYEIMNSTANDRITRLMAIVKDWGNLQQFGSVRSARPTNFLLAREYDAIICHDGGPYFINDYLTKAYTNSLSGSFARFSNGKATEFTEFITSQNYTNPTTGRTYEGLIGRVSDAGYSVSYHDYAQGAPFHFSDEEFLLSSSYQVSSAYSISLPFPHNSSALSYNAETGKYEYSEYGTLQADALDGQATSFENVILEDCDYTVLDENGYMSYNLLDSTVHDGYYITNGEAVPITWTKDAENGQTKFYNAYDNNEIVLNTGKTYIAIVPSDVWSSLSIA